MGISSLITKTFRLGAAGVKGAKEVEFLTKSAKVGKGIKFIKPVEISKTVPKIIKVGEETPVEVILKSSGKEIKSSWSPWKILKPMAYGASIGGGAYLIGKGAGSIANVVQRVRGEPWTYGGEIIGGEGSYDPRTGVFTSFIPSIGEGGEDYYSDALRDTKTGTKIPWFTLLLVGGAGYLLYRAFRKKKGTTIKLQSPLAIKTTSRFKMRS